MIPIKSKKYVIKTFILENGRTPFSEWIRSLDGSLRARISARIARFEDGHFGDHKPIGDGILEARFFFGPGYRVYFSIYGAEIVLLLMGGDKDTQPDDIEKAKEFLKNYLEDQNANKK